MYCIMLKFYMNQGYQLQRILLGVGPLSVDTKSRPLPSLGLQSTRESRDKVWLQ